MSLNTIKKYKEEFDYLLNGGCIYYLLKSDIFGNISYGTATGSTGYDIFKIDSNKIKYIVINDEYIEFRIALVEGKTIQYNNGFGLENWIDINLKECASVFNYSVDRYKIKPEEPKFKEGNWIPEEGEWVIPDSGIKDDSFVVCKYRHQGGLLPRRCEPFIGTLPKSLL